MAEELLRPINLDDKVWIMKRVKKHASNFSPSPGLRRMIIQVSECLLIDQNISHPLSYPVDWVSVIDSSMVVTSLPGAQM